MVNYLRCAKVATYRKFIVEKKRLFFIIRESRSRRFDLLLKLVEFGVDRMGGENILVRNMYLYNYGITLGLAIVYAVAIYGLVKLFDKIKFGKLLFGR